MTLTVNESYGHMFFEAIENRMNSIVFDKSKKRFNGTGFYNHLNRNIHLRKTGDEINCEICQILIERYRICY